MADETKKKAQGTRTIAELAERRRAARRNRPEGPFDKLFSRNDYIPSYIKYLEKLSKQQISDLTASLVESITAVRPLLPRLDVPYPAPDAGTSDASEELQGLEVEITGAAHLMLTEAVCQVSEELMIYEQVRAQLEEVDETIERLGRDREEIDRLKEETRSNISELQRMIAA